jgi:serine/threonine protein kinase
MCPEPLPADSAVTSPQEPAVEDGGVVIASYEILPHQRLRYLDQGPAAAYAVRLRGQVAATMFALICEPWLVPRSKMADALANIANPCFIRVLYKGVVFWSPAKAERYVFIYENNLGQPLMRTHVGQGLGWKNEKVLAAVIRPVANVLLDLRDRDLVHGAINPMNMFDGGSKAIEKVVLGDCLALPPSFAQPAVFEPIERAQCDPLGRGLGTFEDDLYSLGVTLTVLLRTRVPMEGKSDEDIVREKIEQGSYAALTGRERFTGAILELLRGLLYDDRSQRWTLDDMMLWLDGQRLSPKQVSKKLKAARHIQFNGERYNRPSMLAMDLDKNFSEAVQLVDGGDLEQWVQRSLEDHVVRARVEQAIENMHEIGRGPGYPERLVSRISIALDPEAPLRYKNVKVTPAGFGAAFMETIFFHKDINPYLEIINQQLVMYLLNAQYDLRYDVGDMVAKFDSCRGFLRQQNIIYGIERCIYFLLPEAPCLSDRIREFYVLSPEDLLRAFEAISSLPNRPELFIDRHIASFLSVRDRKVVDPYLAELNAPEMHKRVLGNIKVLATIQQRARMEVFPGICKWIGAIMSSYYERIHDRELRQRLQERIERLSEGGDIGKMAKLIDDMEMRQKDFLGFRQAMIEYNKLRHEGHELEEKLAKPEIFAKETGREYAAIISALLAGVIIMVFAFIYFVQGGQL